MLTVILISLGWIACGVLAVLIDTGDWKLFYYKNAYVGWSVLNEFLRIFYFIGGPAGLVTAMISCIVTHRRIYLAVKIPKEIRAPTRESQLIDNLRECINSENFWKTLQEIDDLISRKKRIAKRLAQKIWI